MRESEGEKATPPSEHERLIMINFGGKSYDSGMERLVQLTMVLCNAESVEQLSEEEPHWDELVDILCGKKTASEHYPAQPLAGAEFAARGRNSTKLGGDNEPFINWAFSLCED